MTYIQTETSGFYGFRNFMDGGQKTCIEKQGKDIDEYVPYLCKDILTKFFITSKFIY
jgi:hypothetical protein